MQTVPMGISSTTPSLTHHPLSNRFFSLPPTLSSPTGLYNPSSKSGIQRASQAAELFPTLSPEVVVREARLEDSWEVAETHCSTFFPNYSFPLDLMLRINRVVSLLSGFSVPKGCRKTCLVAVVGSSTLDFFFGHEDFKAGSSEGKFCFNKGSVAGILTVDTVADFLPRKGPLGKRRTGIAYISNLAVGRRHRRKGIARRLMVKAESLAKSWGCHAIALHCETNNQAAMQLYLGHGFRCIKVPEGAKWPRPRTSPGNQFIFLMKLLTTNHPTTI
eukprot:TRINITY_DN5672_c1_g1_i3.p1 TRINITY_DN5672_c1_g1~~TRINITY_DN5672_c1_g1_i3.p1  ORF type:complete len:274 (+),score=57.90 TRINITY_DN5672_c1_g1_i3:77-898(+)